jgi:hypothetical protein
MGLLPDVGHLVHKRGENLLIGSSDKRIRIQREFMSGGLRNSPGELFPVAFGVRRRA